MKDFSEKLLMVAAGAMVGAVGYLAWKNRDELHDLLDTAYDKGKELMEQHVENMSDLAAKTEHKEKGA